MDRIHSVVSKVDNTGEIQVDTIHSVVRCCVNNTGKNMWTEFTQR